MSFSVPGVPTVQPPAIIPSLKLVYAKLQALAEPARMLLSYAEIPYTDEYVWDFTGKPWEDGGKEDPRIPFGQVLGIYTYLPCPFGL